VKRKAADWACCSNWNVQMKSITIG